MALLPAPRPPNHAHTSVTNSHLTFPIISFTSGSPITPPRGGPPPPPAECAWLVAGLRQLEFVVTFLISFEVCVGGRDVGGGGEGRWEGGAEVLSQASQLRLALVNKSGHTNCVCTQA